MKRTKNAPTILEKVKDALQTAKGSVFTLLSAFTPDKSASRDLNRLKNAFATEFDAGVSVSIGNVSIPKNVVASMELAIHRGNLAEARSILLTAIGDSREQIRASRLRLEIVSRLWDTFADEAEKAFDGVDVPVLASSNPQTLDEIVASLAHPKALETATQK